MVGGLQDYTASSLGQVIVIVISRPRSLTILSKPSLVTRQYWPKILLLVRGETKVGSNPDPDNITVGL